MTSSGPSHFEAELREQGAILAARTEPGWEHASMAAELLGRNDVDHVVVAARGTSDNAARYAQYLLGIEARLPVGLAAPWLYSSDSPPRLSRGAVLAISQSGRSPDIVSVAAAARAQDRPTIAITNDVDSPLAAAADIVVPLLAGDERAVAATKTYLASLHAIAQIASCLRPDPSRSTWFERLPELVSETIEGQLDARARFDRLDGAALITVVGRGLQLATAYETALKLRELSAVASEAFSLPDLIHGPIAALRPSGAVWLLSTSGRRQPDRAALAALRQATGVSVAVSDRDDVVAAAEIGIPVAPGLPEWLAPIVSVIPGQAAALRLGELREVDLDQPHGLHKVTLTS
ncbi:MAG TPA: SIS domain-containing protein [Solirubrobacteraceae bacterium]